MVYLGLGIADHTSLPNSSCEACSQAHTERAACIIISSIIVIISVITITVSIISYILLHCYYHYYYYYYCYYEGPCWTGSSSRRTRTRKALPRSQANKQNINEQTHDNNNKSLRSEACGLPSFLCAAYNDTHIYNNVINDDHDNANDNDDGAVLLILVSRQSSVDLRIADPSLEAGFERAAH